MAQSRARESWKKRRTQRGRRRHPAALAPCPNMRAAMHAQSHLTSHRALPAASIDAAAAGGERAKVQGTSHAGARHARSTAGSANLVACPCLPMASSQPAHCHTATGLVPLRSSCVQLITTSAAAVETRPSSGPLQRWCGTSMVQCTWGWLPLPPDRVWGKGGVQCIRICRAPCGAAHVQSNHRCAHVLPPTLLASMQSAAALPLQACCAGAPNEGPGTAPRRQGLARGLRPTCCTKHSTHAALPRVSPVYAAGRANTQQGHRRHTPNTGRAHFNRGATQGQQGAAHFI
jgi:hypothetical protein